MPNSFQILELLKDSLQTSLNTALPERSFLIECSNQNTTELSTRQIPDMRLGIYQRSSSRLNRVDANRMLDFNQTYEISVFFSTPKGRMNEFDTLVEKPLMDTFDQILTWLQSVDVATLTNSEIMYLSFESASSLTRNQEYCYFTIQLSSFRTYKS